MANINCGLTLRKSIKFYLGTCPLKEAASTKHQATIFRKNSFGNRTGSLAESCFTSDGETISMAARDLVQDLKKIKNTNTVRVQASKLSNQPTEASSPTAKGSSFKPKLSSAKIPDPGYKRTSSGFGEPATRTNEFFG